MLGCLGIRGKTRYKLLCMREQAQPIRHCRDNVIMLPNLVLF